MADNDGKIYITISDRRFGSNKAEADEQNKTDKEKDKDNSLADYAVHQFFNLINSQTKQAVNYTIGNIGNFTGNYITQQHVNEALNFVNAGKNIAMAAFAGARYGPYGALLGAAIATIGTGVNYGLEEFSNMLENSRQNRAINQLRTRAGLNSTNNGSRGTDY